MKRQKLLIASVLTMMASFMVPSKSFAQWNTDKNYVTVQEFPADADKHFYAGNPMYARTNDGKIWMSFTNLERLGTRLYVQLLDENLNHVFDEPIMVSQYASPTWFWQYGMATTSDGSLVITWGDSRTETKGKTDEEIMNQEHSCQNWQPAIYKINQKGEFEWGIDGVTNEEIQYADRTTLMVNGEDIYWQIKNNHKGGTKSGSYLMRLDNEGKLGWTEYKRVSGQLVPSLNGDFITVGGAAEAMRYNRDCEPVWDEPVQFDDYATSGMENDPYKIAVDGNGGFGVAYTRYMGQSQHNVRVQYVNGDGETGFGMNGLDVYAPEEAEHNYARIGLNTDTKEIYVLFQSDFASQKEVRGTKFSFGGEQFFGEQGKVIASKNSPNGWSYETLGVGRVGESDWIHVYTDENGYGDASLIIARYDKDGTRLWKKVIGRSIQIYGTDATVYIDEDATYVFWRDEMRDLGLHAVRVYNDGTFDNPTGIYDVNATNPQPVGCYSIDGKKLNGLQDGINIVKYSDGSSKKIIK